MAATATLGCSYLARSHWKVLGESQNAIFGSDPLSRPFGNRRGGVAGSPSFCRWSLSRRRRAAESRGLARGIKISREPAVEKNGRKEEADEDEDDEELCPVECVREVKSKQEFDERVRHGKERGALVVVDFFKTACGSCRYIETGFVKLCKGAGNTDTPVMFLKHNVMDEYEEQSEVAENLKIKVVPLFHFYKDGQLVESFPTREKAKILEAICRHTSLRLEDMPSPRGA